MDALNAFKDAVAKMDDAIVSVLGEQNTRSMTGIRHLRPRPPPAYSSG